MFKTIRHAFLAAVKDVYETLRVNASSVGFFTTLSLVLAFLVSPLVALIFFLGKMISIYACDKLIKAMSDYGTVAKVLAVVATIYAINFVIFTLILCFC